MVEHHEPLQPIATQEAVALFTGTPPDALASIDLCNRLDALNEIVLTTPAGSGWPGPARAVLRICPA